VMLVGEPSVSALGGTAHAAGSVSEPTLDSEEIEVASVREVGEVALPVVLTTCSLALCADDSGTVKSSGVTALGSALVDEHAVRPTPTRSAKETNRTPTRAP
jgi:hypothetical protein